MVGTFVNAYGRTFGAWGKKEPSAVRPTDTESVESWMSKVSSSSVYAMLTKYNKVEEAATIEDLGWVPVGTKAWLTLVGGASIWAGSSAAAYSLPLEQLLGCKKPSVDC